MYRARERLGEDLLVLAGPKSAGKTTLLTNALRDKAPLFGPHIDAAFQATRPPGAEMEFRLRLSEVIARRTWASGPHLLAFAEEPPPTLVAHIDTTDLCQFSARPFESVARVDENVASIAQNPRAAIFSRYKRVHLATLNTPYERCAAWFKARAIRWGKKPSANDERLYSGSAEGLAGFSAVQTAWMTFAASLPNVVAHSRIDYDGELVNVAPIKPSRAVQLWAMALTVIGDLFAQFMGLSEFASAVPV